MLKFKILILSLLSFLIFTSCISQNRPALEKEKLESKSLDLSTPLNSPVAEYIVKIFEDSKGNLWFGTISKGVARYDASPNDSGGQGKSLTYFSTEDGIAGNAVVSIVEDKQGTLWFGTHGGLSKYDGNTFTNFTKKDGLIHDRVSTLLIDENHHLWIGTWGGVSFFDGSTFIDFELPNPDIDIPNYQETQEWVTEIMEDKDGNIWIGRSGYGACKWDGKSFTNFTKKDGLPSNCVQNITEDKQGNIWFGTRVGEKDHPDPEKRVGEGGLSRFDGKTFTHFPEFEGLSKNDIYSIYEDKRGDLWIGANGVGLYRYDGKDFTLFSETDREDMDNKLGGIQGILEDKNGALWIGLSGGLFRLQGLLVNHVTQEDLNN